MLSYLQELIDKRKEAMESARDLYEYERSIAEKTKNIADYQKQLEAYAGDTSEETQAKLQKIKVELEKAEQDLQDAEYDQWLTDQQRLMDDLYSEYEQLLNQRLDDLDALIQEMIEKTNNKADSIQETIKNAASDVGYTLTDEMKTVWSTSDGLGKVVADYTQNFNTIATATQSSIQRIKELLEKMVGEADKNANADIANNNNTANNIPTAPTAPPSGSSGSGSGSGSGSSGSSSSGNGSSGSNNSGWGSWFIHKVDKFPKDRLNINSSIVDRLKYRDYDSSFSARKNYYSAMGGSGTYKGSASQNSWMISQMREHGYKNGTKSARKGFHLMDEEGLGSEFIITPKGVLNQFNDGDHVFNKDRVDNLWELSDIDPRSMLPKLDNIPVVRNQNDNRNVKNDVELNITLPNVKNYEEFKYRLIRDKGFEKAVQDMGLGAALGKNSLTKYNR